MHARVPTCPPHRGRPQDCAVLSTLTDDLDADAHPTTQMHRSSASKKGEARTPVRVDVWIQAKARCRFGSSGGGDAVGGEEKDEREEWMGRGE